MDGLLACPVVVGAAHRLAVDGHHLSGQQVCHPLAPLQEALLEALLEPVRIQAGEHVAEGVTGRDALGQIQIGQIQKGAEPFLLALAAKLHVDPGVRAADDGANGDGDVVQQLVPLAPVNPRVLQFPKTLHDGRSLPFPHHSPHHSQIPWPPIQRQAYHL